MFSNQKQMSVSLKDNDTYFMQMKSTSVVILFYLGLNF